jgi:hypothetical protein
LYLRDLLKKTQKWTLLYDYNCQAIQKIKEIADFINEEKRRCENAQTVAEIQKKLIGKSAVSSDRCQRSFFFSQRVCLTRLKKKKGYLGTGIDLGRRIVLVSKGTKWTSSLVFLVQCFDPHLPKEVQKRFFLFQSQSTRIFSRSPTRSRIL